MKAAMSTHKHDIESTGAKPRDHTHPRHHFLRHAHKDWRVWTAVVLMLAMILVYVMSDSLSLRPGKRATQSTPAAVAP
jgi:Ca2+/H+ antiporter